MEEFVCRDGTLIRQLEAKDDLESSVRVIRNSFAEVAVQFGLTPQNCPTHPSFEALVRLEQMKDGGIELYSLLEGTEQVGFVAIEKAKPGLYYLERLAVLPEKRNCGKGSALVDFVISRVRDLGGNRVSIGIIAESSILREWYKGLGFSEIETRQISGLPFEVCFMEKLIGNARL